MKRSRKLLYELVTPAFLVGLFLVMHLLGARDHTSVLSGTMPTDGGSALGGVIYLLTWFGAVLVAPILALQAPIYQLLERRFGASEEARPEA